MTEPRIPLVDVPQDVLDALVDIGAPAAVKDAPPYRALANHPPALRGWGELSWRLRQAAAPGRLRELAIIRISMLAGVESERQAHEHIALSRSWLSQAEIDQIPDWRTNRSLSTEDRAVLEFSDAVFAGEAPEAVVRRLTELFDSAAVVDIVVTCGFYLMLTRVSRALGTA
ncbi:carboxymuconolactone decarboxylase family protein [Streptomyces muensis]|uniref:Carboxymuconolactone decarboxylase family protein n=1 Tax=Streptomyces muensis TaxID=1077944 RepID=A0A9X1PV83_STRM4|nr:carboxymuconolactone decarboxylase family protein [Streptomyces muensis]MCF1592338.1 carboxymuconolactone decarboxylase family protein [Streptomyces muensis]